MSLKIKCIGKILSIRWKDSVPHRSEKSPSSSSSPLESEKSAGHNWGMCYRCQHSDSHMKSSSGNLLVRGNECARETLKTLSREGRAADLSTTEQMEAAGNDREEWKRLVSVLCTNSDTGRM